MAEAKEQVQFDDFAKLDLRVATVVAAEPHPNADRLLKLQVDLGELGERQICAGVKQFYEPADLIGKQIVVVANLEPRKIRGEESNGMLLAGSHEADGETRDVVVLTPLRPLPNGSKVS